MALDLGKLLTNPYALKLNSLTNLVDLASTAGEMFLVAPEKLQNEVYIFDTRGDEEVTLESEITDNWVEDNSTMQDHIGLKPMTITLSGYVGELKTTPRTKEQAVYEPASSITQALTPLLPKLTTQSQYIFNRAQEAYDIYNKANKTVDRIENTLKQIPVPEEASKQQQAFGRFYEMWATRQLSTVYTPFGAYNSMAIEKVSAKQSEDGVYISEFSVTFKQVRIAQSIYVDKKQRSGRTKNTLSKQVDKGTKKPTTAAAGLLDTILNAYRG
jgi:hypothetical protein